MRRPTARWMLALLVLTLTLPLAACPGGGNDDEYNPPSSRAPTAPEAGSN